jgi:glycosyltransferase involved in cell wall biosynthesis
MRAYHNLLALSAVHDIDLLVVRTGFKNRPPGPDLKALCRDLACIRLEPFRDGPVIGRMVLDRLARVVHPRRRELPHELQSMSGRRLAAAARAHAGKRFDVIHVFRIYAMPYARPYLDQGFSGVLQVDVDDVESLGRYSQGRLDRSERRLKKARRTFREARIYEAVERAWLPSADRVLVCNQADCDLLRDRYGLARVDFLPNIVAAPQARRPARAPGLPVFLLLGSYDYFPNLDGLLFLVREVLPRLRSSLGRPFVLNVAGGGLPLRVIRELAAQPEIRIMGRVEQVTPLYMEADVALVPIRAGGGSRIKALEAFAHGVPVVGTTKGLEGLGVANERQVLVADTPREFAAQCRRLVDQPELRLTLAREATRLWQSQFTLEAITKILTGPGSHQKYPGGPGIRTPGPG